MRKRRIVCSVPADRRSVERVAMDRILSKKTKTTIVVIAVALAVMVAALVVVLIIKSGRLQSDVSVLPENRISRASAFRSAFGSLFLGGKLAAPADDFELSLALNSDNPEENQSFDVSNMFPGDSVTRNYRLDVSFRQKVEILFTAEPYPGYEQASEIFQVKLVLVPTGEVIYEGTVGGMSAPASHLLEHSAPGTEQLYYALTVTLPKEAGNEYQETEARLRFTWTVEDRSELIPPTGDSSPVVLYIVIAACALGVFWVIWGILKKKRGEDEDE